MRPVKSYGKGHANAMVPAIRHVELTSKEIANVSLPPKTKCYVCKRTKQLAQFSNKQLNDLRFRIFTAKSESTSHANGIIRCRVCTGGQNTEMNCIQCGEDKSLEHFSLAQRKKKDDAVCLLCRDVIDGVNPDDRHVATAHDAAVNSASTRDETESNYGDTYKWDRDTGNYATSETISTLGSDGGVALSNATSSFYNGSQARASTSKLQPSSHATGTRIPKNGGVGLTTYNLAKLTIGNDYPRQPLSSIAPPSTTMESAKKNWNSSAAWVGNANVADSSIAGDSIASESTSSAKSHTAPYGGVWLNEREDTDGPSLDHMRNNNEDSGDELYGGDIDDDSKPRIRGVHHKFSTAVGKTFQGFDQNGRRRELQTTASNSHNNTDYGFDSESGIAPAPRMTSRDKFPRVRPVQAQKIQWRAGPQNSIEENVDEDTAVDASVMDNSDSDDD